MRKLKKTPLTFSSWDDLAPLKDAFDRIMPRVGGAPDLAALRLDGDLRNRLGFVVVYLAPDKKHMVTWLTPSDSEKWRHVRALAGDVMEPPVNGYPFVPRVDLDKQYPIPATPTAAQSGGPQSSPPTTRNRRKPGPKLKHNWPLEVAVEVYRFREKEGRTPSASELAQFCYNKWEWAPDDSDINKLLKILLNDYWPLEVAVEVYRFREKEGRTPSASESAQFCYNKWEWAPDDSDINKLLKILLND